jgi:hypothetical protein
VSNRAYKFVFTTEASVEYAFDFEGGWSLQLIPIYRAEDSATGKIVEEVQNRWEITGLLVTPDGTADKAWDTYHAFADAVTGATGDPVSKVELIRDPDGVAVAELTLDETNDYYELRVDQVELVKPDYVPRKALFGTVFPVMVQLSARKIGADIGANDQVTWEQTIRETYRNGLKRLESEVAITTREGVDAVALAKSIASLPIPGATYAYKTGNTVDANGVDVVHLDPDTTQDPDRTVTKVLATCVIQQSGVSVGNTAGGGAGIAPDEVFYENQTTSTKADGTTLKRRNVSASGPNAKAWCISQKPPWATDEDVRELASADAWAYTWTATERTTGASASTTSLSGELTGGGQAFDHEVVTGGYAPVRFDGPVMLWRFSLRILVTRQGGSGANSDLPFPVQLPAPWVLDRQASSEGEPIKQDAGSLDGEAAWTREASLVYVSAADPTIAPVKWLREQDRTQDTYLLAPSA